MRHANHILAMPSFLNKLPDVYVSKMTMITKLSCFVGFEFQDVCVWNVMTYDDMWHDSRCTHTFLDSLCKMMWTSCSLNVVNTMPVSKIYSSLFAAKKWTLKLIELQLKHSKTCSKLILTKCDIDENCRPVKNCLQDKRVIISLVWHKSNTCPTH